MSWGTDYDFWDTPMGIAQDLIDKEIMEKEIEKSFENSEYKIERRIENDEHEGE